MTTRIFLALAVSLALGTASAAAQAPGDPDYEPNQDTVDEYERLGEEQGSEYDLDDGAFDEAADQAAAVVPPSATEVEEFQAGLEAHWGGNLPALWGYLNRIDPAGGSNPEPPGEGEAPYWEPDDDYNEFGNLVESAEEEREWWRQRVEQKLAQIAVR